MPFAATWIDLEITVLSEVTQTKKQIPYSITYVDLKENDTNELSKWK